MVNRVSESGSPQLTNRSPQIGSSNFRVTILFGLDFAFQK
jgi:hypothetical protein